MQLLTLTAILLKDKPDTQTRAFYTRTTAWLGQWTATNNYGPVLIDEDQGVAWRIWRDKFLSQFRSALCDVAEPSDGLEAHFIFKYQITELEVNQEGSTIGMFSVELCDIPNGKALDEFERERILLSYTASLKRRLQLADGSISILEPKEYPISEDKNTIGIISRDHAMLTIRRLRAIIYDAIRIVSEAKKMAEFTEISNEYTAILDGNILWVPLPALSFIGVPFPESLT